MEFKEVLIKIEKTPQFELEKRLFGKGKYLDTPGFCHQRRELKFYNWDVEECMKQNMGKENFNKLKSFLKNNPQKTNKFMNVR